MSIEALGGEQVDVCEPSIRSYTNSRITVVRQWVGRAVKQDGLPHPRNGKVNNPGCYAKGKVEGGYGRLLGGEVLVWTERDRVVSESGRQIGRDHRWLVVRSQRERWEGNKGKLLSFHYARYQGPREAFINNQGS